MRGGKLPWVALTGVAFAMMVCTQPARAEWRTYELVGARWARVTAYCPCTRCCGIHADGRTSTGRSARLAGAAVDPRAIPYGSAIMIPGAGWLRADDTGGAMRRSWRQGVVHVDVRMTDHGAARRWGVRWLRIGVYRPMPRRPPPTLVKSVAPARPVASRNALARLDPPRR